MKPRKLPLGTRGYSPTFTNASVNRQRATEAFAAGLTPKEIAAEWPEVFKVVDGKLGQKYFYEINDGSGRFETDFMITRESVKDAILKKRKKE